MKICSECNVNMIEDTNFHTDYVGGYSFEEQIFLTFVDGTEKVKNIFGNEKEKDTYVTKRVRARVCPNCGKVELFIDYNGN